MITNNYKLTIFFLAMTFAIASCQSSSQKQKLADKEKELLQKENELLKKELASSKADVQDADKPINKFVIDKAAVKKAFLQYLPDISGGRKLNEYWKSSDGKGFKIVLGDINGDNLTDAVVDYSLEPTLEDNGGGGNAIGEIPGLVAFINTGNNLIIADHSEEFGGNFGSRNELRKINNGVIFLEGMDYAEDDARCCPSIKTTTRLVLRNNKLSKLK